ncbi:MAG: glycosyltransferase family 2 protein [Planctomycetota bacterium]|nr:MAG: glycosyltransferase family 2 protein [Planctomycetota bacterium]
MDGAARRLSVVCPAYEEEEVLPHFHRELCSVLAQLEATYDVEILYVDDGSCDGTLEVIRQLAQGDKRVRYLSLSRNFGHQAALTAGLEHAQGDVVITMDTDLQHPPALVPRLLQKWQQGFDIVLTIRKEDPHLGFAKRWTSRWFYRIMHLLGDTDIRLAAADYRLMSDRAVNALLRLRETHRFLRGMVQWLGFTVAEVPFDPAPRKAGTSKYTLQRMFNLALDGLFSFSKLPLRVAPVLGGLCMLLAMLLGAGLLVRAIWPGGEGPSSAAVLLTSLYFLGGSILLTLGIVGEYVGRIYEQTKARPLYLLKDRSPVFSAGLRLDRRHPSSYGRRTRKTATRPR